MKWSEVAQSCPTLCNPMDCGLQGSSVHVIFQARVLEWVAISSSRGSSWPRDWTQVYCIAGRCFTIRVTRELVWRFLKRTKNRTTISSVQSRSWVQLFATPWAAAHQTCLSITNSWSWFKLSPSSQWCKSNISSSVVPFSPCLQPSTAATNMWTISDWLLEDKRPYGTKTNIDQTFLIHVSCWLLTFQ